MTSTLVRSDEVEFDEVWVIDDAAVADEHDLPPLSPRLQFVRAILIVVFMLTATLVLQLTLVSKLQHAAAQTRAFDKFRGELARGTAPVAAVDQQNHLLPVGTPVAYLEIPKLHIKEVVVEGTTSRALSTGPGHRRDTPLPGQIGTSHVFGRRAAFGGPFADLDQLESGDVIKVTTGQGEFEFNVLGVRREGDPAPAPLDAAEARLVLTTASGTPFFPDGALRVDADMADTAVVGAGRVVSPSTLPSEEKVMAGDARSLWVLAAWLQALIALSIGAVWAWHRWGRVQAWVVFFPPLLLVGLFAAGEVARLLPNLM